MTDERWIIIPRWDEFQHRDAGRSTTTPWIKNWTRLLHDQNYLGLTQHQRGVLHGLWLLYALSRRQVAVNTSSLTRQLNGRVSLRQLEALNRAGFIEFSASRPASTDASLEVEVEVERFNKTPRSNGKGDQRRIAAMIRNGALPEPADVEAELAAAEHLTDEQRDFLRSLIDA